VTANLLSHFLSLQPYLFCCKNLPSLSDRRN
jgi:hypothetical protein